MELNLTGEEVRALRRLLLRAPTHGAMSVNALYISPAQQMRNAADEMEQDDRDYPILQEIAKKLN